MSGGGQEINVNSGERAISDDQNRAQRFRGLDLNELLRALCDTNCGLDDTQASSADILSTVATAPSSATVFNGLVVRPQLGTLNLFIDPGVVGLYDPDATPNPDESQFKVIRDPGVSSATPLVMTANTSGATRIDVVECARVGAPGYTVLETDNRDIFNPVSGLFTPTTVNKVIAGRLQYRIRSGTSGGGMPANAAGWLPLAVASVPTGTSTVNGMTFWDVRPFAGDRLFPPFNLASVLPRNRRNAIGIDVITVSGKASLNGYVETSATDPHVLSTGLGGSGYRLGGALSDAVDLNNAANQSGSISNGPCYVYLCEPFGLPRWAQYVLGSGVLAPAYRGIAVLSSVAPLPILGCPSSAIAMPFGLVGTTQKANCIVISKFGGGVVAGVLSDGRTQTVGATTTYPNVGGNPVGSTIQFPFVSGTDFPPHATSVWLTMILTLTVAANTTGSYATSTLSVQDPTFTTTAATLVVGQEEFNNASGGTATFTYVRRLKVPVLPGGFGLSYQTNQVSTTTAGATCVIDGWEF